MRRQMVLWTLLVCLLLLMAAAPWIAARWAPRPVVPDELQRERDAYQTAAVVALQATVEWMRTATSIPRVRIIGTVVSTSAPFDGDASPTITPAGASRTPSPPGEATLSPSSRAVSTVVAGATPSVVSIRIVLGTPVSPQAPEPSTAKAIVTTDGPPLPSGLVDTEDVVTEESLTQQVQEDLDDGSLSELTISLSPDGVQATAIVERLRGVRQRIEAEGTLAVGDYLLVVEVSSIELDDLDVTDLYRGELESRINSSLYRLLPQRYVQSYELAVGEVRVWSKVRP